MLLKMPLISRLGMQKIFRLAETVHIAIPNVCRWEAASMSKVSFTVPDNWKAGRIWVC